MNKLMVWPNSPSFLFFLNIFVLDGTQWHIFIEAKVGEGRSGDEVELS